MPENGEYATAQIRQLRVDVAAALRTDSSQIFRLVCEAAVDLLGVDGAALSMASDDHSRETLFASDDRIARIESLQQTLGEGPSFEAVRTRRSILVPELERNAGANWPVLRSELVTHDVAALFSFPLQIGVIAVGTMDLYRRQAGWFGEAELIAALRVVDVATVAMLNLRPSGLVTGEGDEWFAHLPPDRYVVHQATGMLAAELRIPAEQALARLRGYAFGSGQLVEDVARALTSRSMSPAEIEI